MIRLSRATAVKIDTTAYVDVFVWLSFYCHLAFLPIFKEEEEAAHSSREENHSV